MAQQTNKQTNTNDGSHNSRKLKFKLITLKIRYL